MRKAFLTQQNLLKHLNDAAREVKSCSDSTKKIVLQNHMKTIDLHLKEMAMDLISATRFNLRRKEMCQLVLGLSPMR